MNQQPQQDTQTKKQRKPREKKVRTEEQIQKDRERMSHARQFRFLGKDKKLEEVPQPL